MAFYRHDLIRHVRTGGMYMVLASPADGVRLEADGAPAYIYQWFWGKPGDTLWVRAASVMEDGRFELAQKTTQGALGRFPEG